MFVILGNDYILNVKPVVYALLFLPTAVVCTPTRFNRTISQKTKYFYENAYGISKVMFQWNLFLINSLSHYLFPRKKKDSIK